MNVNGHPLASWITVSCIPRSFCFHLCQSLLLTVPDALRENRLDRSAQAGRGGGGADGLGLPGSGVGSAKTSGPAGIGGGGSLGSAGFLGGWAGSLTGWAGGGGFWRLLFSIS